MDDILKSKQYTLIKELGYGSAGTVFLAIHPHYQYVVIKKFSERRKGLQEISVMRKIPVHDNIIKYIDDIDTINELVIITTFVPGKDLFDSLSAYGTSVLGVASSVYTQMKSAIAFLHERNIVHRDIKHENIVADDTLSHFTLIDFDSAIAFPLTAFSRPIAIAGTPGFLSREMQTEYEQNIYHNRELPQVISPYIRNDWFSLAVVVYQLLHQMDYPYDTLQLEEDQIHFYNFNEPHFVVDDTASPIIQDITTWLEY